MSHADSRLQRRRHVFPCVTAIVLIGALLAPGAAAKRRRPVPRAALVVGGHQPLTTSLSEVMKGDTGQTDRLRQRVERAGLLTLDPTPEATAAFERAERLFAAFQRITLAKVRRLSGALPVMLRKADALKRAERAYAEVIALAIEQRASGSLVPAAFFRIGLLYYEFKEDLFRAPIPPELRHESGFDEQGVPARGRATGHSLCRGGGGADGDELFGTNAVSFSAEPAPVARFGHPPVHWFAG